MKSEYTFFKGRPSCNCSILLSLLLCLGWLTSEIHAGKLYSTSENWDMART